MSMTDDDWEKFLHEGPDAEQEPEEQELNKIKYKSKMRETAKAEFYITSYRNGCTVGFWIPKSAIVKVHQGHVYAEPWFEPEEITYV